MNDDPEDAEEALIDVSGLSLRDLDKLGDSHLAAELRWLLGRDGGDSDASVSNFTQSV